MAINSNILSRRGAADRYLFLAAAVVFPLLVLAGYFESYYFRPFFTDSPLRGSFTHAHGAVMTLWVIYFTAQIVLARTGNIRLHAGLGLLGVGLAALVVVTGLAAAYDAHFIRDVSPRGIPAHKFFIVPLGDMTLFVIYFAGAIYYRRRPAEHKSLMLMTAINFLPPALTRIDFISDRFGILWDWGAPDLVALACVGWLAWRHGRLNKVFLSAALLLVASQPFRFFFVETALWGGFTDWLASLR